MSGSQINKGNATASFSGFLYQADIALWKTLEKIKKIGDDKEELEKWSLEVEGEEDFTLYRFEDGKEEIRESYQVKETNKTNPSDYTEAVIKLFHENQKEGKRKSFLVTEKKIDINKSDYIKFLDGLYSGTGLSEVQKLLQYLKSGIGGKQTFLSNKITYDKNRTRLHQGKTVPNKYKFNGIETQKSIKSFVKKETDIFFKNHFKYIFGNNKDTVHKEINTLLKSLNSKIDPEYHFRYLESKIKRFIQERKKNPIYPKIKFSEIVKYINKFGDDIIDEVVSNEFYQCVFINHFIKFFNVCIEEVFEDDFILKYIKEDIGIEYLDFKDDFKSSIGKNILDNNEKLLLFINDTSLKEGFNYIIEKSKEKRKENFKNLLTNNSTFIQKDNLKNKIKLLIKLYYFKVKGLSITNDGYFSNDLSNKTGFKIGGKKAIFTGSQQLSGDDSRSDIKKIIEKNFYYLYELDFIGIRESCGNIDCFLDIKENIEKDKVGFNKEKKEKYDITRIKNINIFCGNCKLEHKDMLLSEECGKNNCKYKS